MEEYIKFKKSVKLLIISLCLLVFFGILSSVFIRGNTDSTLLWLIYPQGLAYCFFVITFWIVAVKIYFYTKVLRSKKIVKSHPGAFVFLWVGCSIIPFFLHSFYIFYLWNLGKKKLLLENKS